MLLGEAGVGPSDIFLSSLTLAGRLVPPVWWTVVAHEVRRGRERHRMWRGGCEEGRDGCIEREC